MRLGVIPDGPMERLALASGLVPTPLVTGAWGLFVSECLRVATRLGVFDALEPGERSVDELAQALGLRQAGLEPLLKALNGFGYLRHRDGRYSLSRVARRWLISASPRSLRDAILFLDLLARWMGGMEEAVRTGETVRLHEGRLAPEDWERYLRGLAAFARPAGREVVRRVKLDGTPKRLLDVGGGHGLYSAAFCQRHPGLAAEVLDLPGAVEVGRRIVAEAGMAERVRYREGDMRQVPWGEGHDAVLIFNVLHNATEDEARELVGRAFRALRPGGTLAVLEAEYRRTRGDLDASSGFGELFFFVVSGARTWPEATLRGWMEAAGFERPTTSRLLMAPAVLLTGHRPR